MFQLRAERIAEWSNNNPQPPVRVELHPTDRCNLKCRFCWQSSVDTIDTLHELPDVKLYEIVNEAASIGVKEWIISGGGEPLVRKKTTMDILKLIKKHHMWGQLTTNGVLFNKDDIQTVVDIGWDQIQFSIDSPDEKIHDYLRGLDGTFKKATENARVLSNVKERSGKKSTYLGFNTVLNRLNYKKLPEMIELCYDVGFQLVYFEPIYAGYVSKERLSLNNKEKEEMNTYIIEAIKTAKNLRINTNIQQFMKKQLIDKSNFENTVLRETEQHENAFLAAPCYQPWYLMGIKGSGLAGCCSTFEIGEKIHNKTLEEVWYGNVFNNIRKCMLSKQLPDYCSKCSVVVVMENKEIRKRLGQILENRKRNSFGLKFKKLVGLIK